MRIWGMRPGVTIALSAFDRRRLEAIVGNRNAPQKHAWRAEIVLLSAGGLGTVEIMRRTGKSKTCVWRWQERFAEAGVAGLLRDKTRPPRVKPLCRRSAHGLEPHRVRRFKLSTDPEFVPKLRDIVGLYVDPPAHAVVLSVDEKSHVWMAPGSQEKSG
jgi:hypothetical protein